jgi:hypothetical protein
VVSTPDFESGVVGSNRQLSVAASENPSGSKFCRPRDDAVGGMPVIHDVRKRIVSEGKE